MNRLKIALIVLMSLILCSCANLFESKNSGDEDFTATKARSILVLPPVNKTNYKKAYEIVLSQITKPLAEKGYYVLPVAVTTELLRQNGVTDARVAQKLSTDRLRKIFGADSALYLTVTEFGKIYKGPVKGNVITISALLTDLKTGSPIWQGRSTANSNTEIASSDEGWFSGLLVSEEKPVEPATAADRLVIKALDALFSDQTQFANGPYLNK